MLRIFVFSILILLPLMSGSPAVAASPGVQVTVVSHGIKLSLSLPRQTYPTNALIRVRLTVTNVSNHVILLRRLECMKNPGISVTTASGSQLFPPALPSLAIGLCGPLLRPGGLSPHRTLSTTELAIVRASHLQMILDVVSRNGTISHLTGPALVVSLDSAPQPTIALRDTGALSATATVVPPPGVRGSMLYQDSWGCKRADGAISDWFSPTPIWTKQRGTTISVTWSSVCTTSRWWHVVAGWIGHPIASLDYGNDPGVPPKFGKVDR